MNYLKQLTANVKKNAFEYYITALLIVGVPFVAYIYLDWRAAVTAFVLVNVAIGVIALRNGK